MQNLNLEVRKLEMIKLIVNMQNDKLLTDFEIYFKKKLSKNNKIIAFTVTGKPLTIKDYQENIYKLSDEAKSGKYIKHSEVLKEIENG